MTKTSILPNNISAWTNDIFASSVVFFVALPLCLGIALASGAPLPAGLLAGIIGGLVVGALSGSHSSVSGPAAGLTAVVAAQIAILGSFEAFLAALIVAGIIQVAMGMAKAGFISAFFPSSVIKGLLASIGIILILKQLPHLVGWDIDAEGEMAFLQQDNQNTFSEIKQMFFHFHEGAVLIGLISLAVLVLWGRSSRLKASGIPSSLLVVALALGVNYLLSFFGGDWLVGAAHRVQVPVAQDFLSMLDFLRTPDYSAFFSPQVYIAGFTLALVASLETLLNIEAVDKIDPFQRVSPPNQELIAQGIGNMCSGFIGGLPVTSVIIRSTVNLNAGGKTKASAMIHGALLLLCVLFVPHWLNAIPLSCLAAILIMTAFKLVNPRIVQQVYRQGASQFLPFAATVTAIIFTDLLVGVIIGLATSAIFILWSSARKPIEVTDEQHMNGLVKHVVMADQVSFLNRAALDSILKEVPHGGHILLDARNTDYIDPDILSLINDFKNTSAPAREIVLSLRGFKKEFGFINEIRYIEHATSELQRDLNHPQILQILKEGNERALAGKRLQRNINRQIDTTSDGQYPLGAVLSCMDSRTPVELIFDLGIGDIFSIRMAGNVVSDRVLGSLEFSCAIAGAKLIVVMGHTRCGAVSAAIDYARSGDSVLNSTDCEHLESVLVDIQKVVCQNSSLPIPSKEQLNRADFEKLIIEAHVQECIRSILQQSSKLRKLVKQNKIAIAGCVYDVSTGKANFLGPQNSYMNAAASTPSLPLPAAVFMD